MKIRALRIKSSEISIAGCLENVVDSTGNKEIRQHCLIIRRNGLRTQLGFNHAI